MSDDWAELHNQALGEALYASTLATLTFHHVMLDQPRQKTAEILDQALMVIERFPGHAQGGPGAAEHARMRLEGLLRLYRTPDQPAPPDAE